MTQLDHYESALLAELRSVVEERQQPRRSRRRYLYAGLAAAAAAGVAFALVPGPATTTPAYAFTETADGTVHVEVGTDATPEDLEAAFADHGITADVTYLDPGLWCASPRGTVGTMPRGRWTVAFGVSHEGFAMDIPAGFPVAGDTLVLVSTRPSSLPLDADAPLDKIATMGMGFVAGPVSPCQPVPIQE